MNPDDVVSRAIARTAHSQRATLTMQETVDRLWNLAAEVMLDNGQKYETVRNAIAWLEVLRNA